MKTFNAKRYKCDFCGKNQRQRKAMERHEEGCTANPYRICRMHKYATGEEFPVIPPITELLAILEEHQGDLDHGLKELRDAADDCPCCILSAIRLSGFCRGTGKEGHIENGEYVSDYVEPLIGQEQFDFKKEVASLWSEYRSME